MRTISAVFLVVTLFTAASLAQPQLGRVDVSIYLANGLLTGGTVRLAQNGDVSDRAFFKAETVGGSAVFDAVPAGDYSVLATRLGEGFAATTVHVMPNGMSSMNCTLSGRKTGSATCDSLDESTLRGHAIVAVPDETHSASRYWLDVNGDGVKDFRLIFGPPSYIPPSGATRPINGDEIELNVGLFSYGCDTTNDAPMILVFTLNGQVWRESENGGNAGRQGFGFRHCDGHLDGAIPPEQPSLPRADLLGQFYITLCDPVPPNPPGVFRFNEAGDSIRSFSQYLNFGTSYVFNWNDLMNADIIGGLMAISDTVTPWVVAYEINGRFVREPGDTLNLTTSATGDVHEPVHVGEPLSYLTAHNYPNPFNAVTTLRYSIPVAGDAELSVFDVTGRQVATLVNGYQRPGEYAVPWNAAGYSSGIYFYRLTVGTSAFTNRMVLLK